LPSVLSAGGEQVPSNSMQKHSKEKKMKEVKRSDIKVKRIILIKEENTTKFQKRIKK
jgi:hypothetical protein